MAAKARRARTRATAGAYGADGGRTGHLPLGRMPEGDRVFTSPPRRTGTDVLVELSPLEQGAIRVAGVWVSPGEVAHLPEADATALVAAGRARTLEAPVEPPVEP